MALVSLGIALQRSTLEFTGMFLKTEQLLFIHIFCSSDEMAKKQWKYEAWDGSTYNTVWVITLGPLPSHVLTKWNLSNMFHLIFKVLVWKAALNAARMMQIWNNPNTAQLCCITLWCKTEVSEFITFSFTCEQFKPFCVLFVMCSNCWHLTLWLHHQFNCATTMELPNLKWLQSRHHWSDREQSDDQY